MIKFKNGKFRIMQITDIQDTQFTAPDTIKFICAALDEIKPDLVVFTGDQVKSYGLGIHLGFPEANMKKTIRHIIKPLADRNIPFTFVFGNHDVPKGMDRKWQADVYESYPQCVNNECFARYNNTDTMCLPVYSGDGKKIELGLYLIDNCGRRENGGNGVSKEQMDWLEKANDVLTDLNSGSPVPCLVFQHIPVYEMYEMLDEVIQGCDGAIEGNCTKRGHYYKITDEMKARGEYMHESVACPGTITDQFERWVKMGNIIGAYFGHDHINSFTGRVRGINLGYTPGAGFNVYGPSFDRGVRIFDFEEGQSDYNTMIFTYRDLCGKKVSNRLKFEFYNRAPSSVDAAKPLIKKGVTALTAAAALTATAIIKSNSKK